MTSRTDVDEAASGDHQYQLIEFLVPNCEDSPKKTRTPKNKSKAWLYFDKNDTNSATCKICNKVIRTCGNTSNLAKHLNVHETAGHIENVSGDKNIHEDLKPTLDEIRQKEKTNAKPGPKFTITLPKNIETLIQKANPIKVNAKSNNPIILKRKVSNPKNINPSTTPRLKDPVTFPKRKNSSTIVKLVKNVQSSGNSRQSEITDCLLYYICTDKVPLRSVEGRGFRKLMKNIIPTYIIPKISHLKKCIDEKYEVLQAVYITKLSKASHVSLTCDICSEKKTEKYFTVAAHFIENANLTSVCIAVEELPEHYDADYVGEKLMEILAIWNIDVTKIVAIVTDNNTKIMNTVVDCFGKQRHIPCFGYSLNLVVENTLKESFITSVLEKVRSIVLWVKNNAEVTEKIRNRQTSTGNEPKEVVTDSSGRWNSIYYMLERFMELGKILDDVLIFYNDAPEMPNELDLTIIKQLLLLLKPLEYMSKEVSSELYVSISKIIPMMNCVTNEYNNVDFENDDIQLLKSEILSEIDKRFGQIELCSTIALATLLDPRFKNIHFQDQHVAARSLRMLIENGDNDLSMDTDCDMKTDIAPVKYDIWNHHKSYVHKQRMKKIVSISSSIKNDIYDEVAVYLDNSVSPLWSNPYSQWEEMKTVFPGLYKQAMKHLTIPATCIPGENLFSKCGPIINQIRNGLLGKKASKIMFLGSCKEEEWS